MGGIFLHGGSTCKAAHAIRFFECRIQNWWGSGGRPAGSTSGALLRERPPKESVPSAYRCGPPQQYYQQCTRGRHAMRRSAPDTTRRAAQTPGMPPVIADNPPEPHVQGVHLTPLHTTSKPFTLALPCGTALAQASLAPAKSPAKSPTTTASASSFTVVWREPR